MQYILFAAATVAVIAALALFTINTVDCCRRFGPIKKSIFAITAAGCYILFGYSTFETARGMWKGIDQTTNLCFIVPLHIFVLAVFVLLWFFGKKMQQAFDRTTKV